MRIAFVHPDLGIGGAERLVVDAALALKRRGHEVDIYTSHHDVNHCFEETRDSSLLTVHAHKPPFPRAIQGKFHILLAHLRQLHLTWHLLNPWAPQYDVFFVDQLSTCIPIIRFLGKTRVLFYCHFPDKLLADGERFDGHFSTNKHKSSLFKRVYRYPMDWLEEFTTGQADTILANSQFTSGVFQTYFPSINCIPKVVYPGINIDQYMQAVDPNDNTVMDLAKHLDGDPCYTLVSLNRFEKKKNVALALQAFAKLRTKLASNPKFRRLRLVIAGGFDPRVENNVDTLASLIEVSKSLRLKYDVLCYGSKFSTQSLGATPVAPEVLFILNFSGAQRTYLLTHPTTKAMLYTPANEHFGIGPVEGMICGLSVLACDSGGPVESILTEPPKERTGWRCDPDPDAWAEMLKDIVTMPDPERLLLSNRAKERARKMFGLDVMGRELEDALKATAAMGPLNADRDKFLLIVLLAACFAAVAAYRTASRLASSLL